MNPNVGTLHQAAKSGDLALVQWLMAPERGAQRVHPDVETLNDAARSGNLALVQWLMAPERGEQRVDPDDLTLYWAALSGNLALVQWLMAAERGAQRVNPDGGALECAAESGNLALVQWLMAAERGEQRMDPYDGILRQAANSDNLALVQWLMAPERGAQRVEPSPKLRQDRSISRAIRLWFEQALQSKNSPTAAPISTHSTSQQLQGAESKTSTNSSSNIPVTSTSSSITTNSTYQVNEQKETEENQLISLHNLEHWSLLKVMASSPDEVITQTDNWINKTKAKLKQHTQTVIPANRQSWLLPDAQVYQRFVALSKLTKNTQEQYTTGDPTLFQHALSKEQITQLPLQDYLQKAASVGNVALVQWLVASERGVQRAIATKATLLAAAQSGSLELVQWLVAAERGAQRLHPDQTILSAAARSGNLALVKWLTAPEHGPQQLKPSRVTLSFARLSGNRALVKWLKQVMQLQEWKDLFPTTAINKEILSYLPGEDILSFANTTPSADQLVTDTKILAERIRSEFGRNIQTLIPANRQSLLLSHTHIYQHLTAWSKLDSQTRNRYDPDDPTLFQHALSTDVVELPLWYDYLGKAARVGNLTLMQWLMAPERIPANRQSLLLSHTHIYQHLTAWSKLDSQTRNRYDPDDPTLFQRALSTDVVELPLWYDYLGKAARVGNLTLMQWLMAPARMPADRQPLLLSHTYIYRHFTALSKLGRQTHNRYALDDPALFQCALSVGIVELPLLYDYLDKAARVGNLALVQWLMAEEHGAQHVNPDIETLRQAAGSGNLALVQWLMAPERGAQRVNPNAFTLEDAAKSGNLALVEWLMAPERGAQRVNPDIDTLCQAAESGNLALVQWLMVPERGAQRVKLSFGVVDAAALSGNLALVQWLMAEGRGAKGVYSCTKTFRRAAWSGNLALAQWLMAPERGAPRMDPDTYTLDAAAWSGNLALVQWLMAPERGAQQLSPDLATFGDAVKSGNLVLVQWLMAEERGAQRVNPDFGALWAAAGSGNLALVQWLMAPERGAQRVDPDVYTLRRAAESGNLALVQWLMAEERGTQQVEPSPEFIAQMREGKLVTTRAIKLWIEQTLQLREAATAVPISTPNTGNPQQPLSLESKAPHSADNRAQRLLNSESKPFYPALPDSKGISVLDSKTLSIQQAQTPATYSSSSSVSTTAFSSTVKKTGSPIHSEAKQQQAAASSQPKQADTGSQTGHETSSSSLSSAGSDNPEAEDSQPEQPPGSQGNSVA